MNVPRPSTSHLFVYCKRSKTGQCKGLGTRVSNGDSQLLQEFYLGCILLYSTRIRALIIRKCPPCLQQSSLVLHKSHRLLRMRLHISSTMVDIIVPVVLSIRPSTAVLLADTIVTISVQPGGTLLKIWCWHNTFRDVNKPFKYNTPRVLWEGVG